MFGSKTVIAAIALLVGVALALFGYARYSAHQKQLEQQRLAALVGQTTALLHQALATPSGESVAAIDAGLEQLKSSRERAFAGAAEQYIVSAREIARQRFDAERLGLEAAASRQALIGHMNRSARRDSAWIKRALELKRNVETAHGDLARALKAVDDLLYGLIDAQKQLAPFVDQALLLPGPERERARERARAEAQRAEVELQKVRNITP